MHQHNPDEPRVDATVAYTGELDLNFTAQYPLLQTEQDIGMLLDGQTPFVSLKIPRTPTTDPFFKKALATILEVAGTEGHPAYSAHAFGGHTTAPEVIDTICQYIAAGDFTVEPQRHYKKVRVLTPTGAEAQETVLVERYIVKTPPYERTTGVPVPRLEQQRIFSSGIEEKGQLKQARRLTRERGAAFGDHTVERCERQCQHDDVSGHRCVGVCAGQHLNGVSALDCQRCDCLAHIAGADDRYSCHV